MSTPQWEVFLDLLQQRDAVPEKLIRHLRKQLQARQPPPSARSVAAWLVDHGHLTRFQALELLKAAGAAEDPAKKSSSAPEKNKARESQLPEATPSPAAEDQFAGPRPTAPGGTAPALLDDLEALSAAGAAELGPQAVAPGTSPPGWGWPRVKRSVWESPLFLLGGGGLILLLVVAAVLYWAIGRESSDQLLQSAEEDYNNGAYTQAIEKFERFLEYFPEDPRAGRIRVLRGLAIMRRAVDQSTDWEKTLQILEGALKEIRREKSFPEARPELAAMLPRVAEGLTDMAQQRQDADLLEKARRVYRMILNPNYVPDKLRNRTRLATLEGRFAQIERMLGRNRRLSEALEQIQAAIAQKQTQQAYNIRRLLLKEYPELETNPQLQQAIARATDAERQAIGYDSQAKVPEAPLPKFSQAAVPMALTQGETIPEAKGRMLYVMAAGAVWALSAEDGSVRWRRFLGKDLWLLPEVLSDRTPEDVVVWSAEHKQLWCLQGKDGSLRWHVPLPEEPAADLAVLRGRVYVALQNQLWEIDAREGKVLGRYVFPQSLSAPPTVSESRLFLPAGHSNVYVIDLNQHRCVGAYYLGHEQDTIVVPPMVAGPFLILAENAGRESSRLRVLRYEAKKHTLRLVQSVRLRGQVFRPMTLQGRVLAVATDLGHVSLFEVNPNPGKKDKPLSPVASRSAVFEKPGSVQLLLDGPYAWIADRRLTRYRIQAAEGQMNPDRVLLEKASFPIPLRKLGAVLFAAAQYEDGTMRVSAFRIPGGQGIWTTRFAAPVSWTPLRQQRKDGTREIFLIDRRGGIYQPGQARLERSSAVAPRWSLLPPGAGTAELPQTWLSSAAGVWVGRMPVGSRRLPVLQRTSAQAWQLHWHALPEALAIPPIPWRDKLLLVGASGSVFLLDPQSGRMLGAPYFPATVPGKPLRWLPAVGSGQEHVVLISDGGQSVLFDRFPERQASLLPARTAQLPGPLRGPVVLFRQSAWVRKAAGRWVRVLLPQLKVAASGEEKEKPSPGKFRTETAWDPVWGPVLCGPHHALGLSRNGELFCLTPEKLLWRRNFSGRLPVGEPVSLGRRECLLAVASGKVLRLDLNTGAVSGELATEEALAGSPLLLENDRVLVPTPGGAFHVLAPPEAGEARAPVFRSLPR